MIVKTMRLGRTALVLASLALAVSACGDQPSSGSAASGSSAPDDSAATESGSSLGAELGDYDGLCSWVSPSDLEAIFGEPVDAVGTKECRIVPADSAGSDGFYHVRLDQDAGFDALLANLEQNQSGMGFSICDTDSTRWQGMRLSRQVTCPDGGGGDFAPQVSLEIGPGRVLTNQPFSADSEQAAQEASQRFVEIMKVFAAGVEGKPVINEVMPGAWLEVYNPGKQPVDLSGAELTGYDDFDDSLSGTLPVPDGSTVAPGQRLVLDISGLEGTTGDTPFIQLADADGRLIDVVELTSVDDGEVVRRNGDGGTFCAFGSADVTQGEPNPARTDRCE
ncbi:lamin tail domain-containing protein [Nocardioides hwasunensis]|uniref:Lamin tail domain-containing protein n=1 Tax=Nocardioides hwasunensis TaxID=397258 RepID=A0ABR8MIX8_9ACTN|nr:lamin tail domain-containing protein [Nocardioides hwasunensis]MBD3915535.1 lamin tail domain-containing protein [Nocardioides hwasunensis]